MIFLYTFLVLFLGGVKVLIDRRVRRLERKYSKTAREVAELVRQNLPRDGNANRTDPCQSAKRQFLIGLLVQKRDRLEALHDTWLARSERFNKFVTRVRNWKGKKLPYTLGVVDVALVLYLIDQLGVGEYVSFRHIVQLVSSYLQA
jgi:hypothetical protein